jgi:hypothetical protein
MCISHQHHTINHMFNGGLQFNLNGQDISRLMKLCTYKADLAEWGAWFVIMLREWALQCTNDVGFEFGLLKNENTKMVPFNIDSTNGRYNTDASIK